MALIGVTSGPGSGLVIELVVTSREWVGGFTGYHLEEGGRCFQWRLFQGSG